MFNKSSLGESTKIMDTQKRLAIEFVTLQGVLPCHVLRAVPGFFQNWWHQPHENLESRVEIEFIELDGDQETQRSGQLYLEL